jgi:hypothetical protein
VGYYYCDSADCPDSKLAMSEPEEPAKTGSEIVDKFFKYLAEVNLSVAAAEQYLEVPPTTISSIQHDPDYIATVKTYAVIEPILNDLIISARPQRNYGTLAAVLAAGEEDYQGYQTFVTGLGVGGRVGKVKLAKALGLLTQDQVHFIQGVTTIRNRYAHNVRNMHRSLVDILSEEQRRNAKIVEHVTGFPSALPLSPKWIEAHLKLFMYFRLADYLSNALKTLKPPPLPKDGIKGLLDSMAP